MKFLVVDDDFTNRLLLQEILKPFGDVHLAANGLEGVFAVQQALEAGAPYTLICLDIMMPELDGQGALREIRELEAQRQIAPRDGVKVLMTSALDDPKNVFEAFKELCDGYLVKPIRRARLLEELQKLGLLR